MKYVEDYLKRVSGDHITVVMNGKIKPDCGFLIDDSETVFRFNLYQAGGKFAKQVGTKTTHWFVNGDASIAVHDTGKVALCPFPEAKYHAKQVSAFKQHCEILYTEKDYREYKADGIEFPTTGYTCLLMLLQIFKGDVYLFGMDGLKTGHYWNKNHKHAKRHSGKLEYDHIKTFKQIII